MNAWKDNKVTLIAINTVADAALYLSKHDYRLERITINKDGHGFIQINRPLRTCPHGQTLAPPEPVTSKLDGVRTMGVTVCWRKH